MIRFFVFIVAIILLSGMPESAEANSSQAYNVGTSPLHVRNAPQINVEVIGSIPRGSTLQVYEKRPRLFITAAPVGLLQHIDSAHPKSLFNRLIAGKLL